MTTLRLWGWIACGWLLVALAWTPASTLVNVSEPEAIDFLRVLAYNILHFGTWALVTPLLFRMCHLWPLHGHRAFGNAVLLLLAGLLIIPAVTAVLPMLQAAANLIGSGSIVSAPDLAQLAQRVVITSLFAVPTFIAVIAIGQTLVWSRRAERHAQDAAGAELRALRAELNPHFLFNTLGSIAQLAHQSPAKAESVIASLADVLRTSLAETDHIQTLAEAVGEIEEHLSLYRMLHGDIRFERVIPDDLWRQAVPTRMLLPLVENAMTHGACNEDGVRWLRLEAARADAGKVTLELSNPTPPVAEPSRGLGSGIETARRLLAIHCGKAATLEHDRSGGVFRVSIGLPA